MPHTATHDWVRSVFSEYGIVAYVSLPKYKSTGDIKGFAFVEYEEEEAAMQACQVRMDGVYNEFYIQSATFMMPKLWRCIVL